MCLPSVAISRRIGKNHQHLVSVWFGDIVVHMVTLRQVPLHSQPSIQRLFLPWYPTRHVSPNPLLIINVNQPLITTQMPEINAKWMEMITKMPTYLQISPHILLHLCKINNFFYVIYIEAVSFLLIFDRNQTENFFLHTFIEFKVSNTPHHKLVTLFFKTVALCNVFFAHIIIL